MEESWQVRRSPRAARRTPSPRSRPPPSAVLVTAVTVEGVVEVVVSASPPRCRGDGAAPAVLVTAVTVEGVVEVVVSASPPRCRRSLDRRGDGAEVEGVLVGALPVGDGPQRDSSGC